MDSSPDLREFSDPQFIEQLRVNHQPQNYDLFNEIKEEFEKVHK
jgi:hypothetical protein